MDLNSTRDNLASKLDSHLSIDSRMSASLCRAVVPGESAGPFLMEDSISSGSEP